MTCLDTLVVTSTSTLWCECGCCAHDTDLTTVPALLSTMRLQVNSRRFPSTRARSPRSSVSRVSLPPSGSTKMAPSAHSPMRSPFRATLTPVSLRFGPMDTTCVWSTHTKRPLSTSVVQETITRSVTPTPTMIRSSPKFPALSTASREVRTHTFFPLSRTPPRLTSKRSSSHWLINTDEQADLGHPSRLRGCSCPSSCGLSGHSLRFMMTITSGDQSCRQH